MTDLITGARLAPLLALASAALLVAGCGRGVSMPNYGSEEGLQLAQFVSDFNDAKADRRKFAQMFADKAPANWKEYYPYTYNVVPGSPKVSGDSATAAVEVRKDADYSLIDTRDWTFVKVGGKWKLKLAPLPPRK